MPASCSVARQREACARLGERRGETRCRSRRPAAARRTARGRRRSPAARPAGAAARTARAAASVGEHRVVDDARDRQRCGPPCTTRCPTARGRAAQPVERRMDGLGVIGDAAAADPIDRTARDRALVVEQRVLERRRSAVDREDAGHAGPRPVADLGHVLEVLARRTRGGARACRGTRRSSSAAFAGGLRARRSASMARW